MIYSKSRLALLCLSGTALVSLAACGGGSPGKEADILFTNGKVLTVDKDFGIQSVVAVKDGKILAVGGAELAKEYSAPQVIDLGGRVLMPGFTDTHVHVRALAPREVDLSDAKSIKEIQDRVRAKAQELGKGEWVTGRAWDEALLTEKRVPLRGDLDAAAPDNPVVLTRAGGHSNVANSLAMKLAKIDRNTPDPKAAVIEKDAKGEPNGIIRENNPYRDLIPPDTFEQLRPNLIKAIKGLLPLGITSFHEASSTINDEPVGKGGLENPGSGNTFKRMKEIYAEQGNDLPRATLYINYPGPERLKAFPMRSGDGDTHVRLGGIGENAVDGGFTGPAAWLSTEYRGMPGFRGKGRYTDAELQALTDDVARNGWQMAIHAIGDAAIVQAVKAYSKSLNTIQGPGRQGKERRWFLDHLTIMPPEDTLKTMGQDGIMAAAQPNFLYNLEGRYRQWLNADMLTHNNPVATPVKNGVFVAFGSDNLPIGPMVGLYAAITRKGPSGQAMGLAEEGVSRQDAIRMYTANGPYLSWEEGIKGTIEAGKLADIIVLDKDILTIPEDQILNTNVDMTFVGGKLVYERK